ncbi:MAG: hypothetical protein HZC41_24985 [Chloroflexi bacterium]|nr:hypothetical protein [Chloroflexota bacterium]
MILDDYAERQRLANFIAWQAYNDAEKLVNAGALQHMSNADLGERYKALCALIPEPRGAFVDDIPCQPRVDDGWIEWEQCYGAEATAIEMELRRRR